MILKRYFRVDTTEGALLEPRSQSGTESHCVGSALVIALLPPPLEEVRKDESWSKQRDSFHLRVKHTYSASTARGRMRRAELSIVARQYGVGALRCNEGYSGMMGHRLRAGQRFLVPSI